MSPNDGDRRESATNLENRLRTMNRPMNGERSIHMGRDPSTRLAKSPIPDGCGSTRRWAAMKTRYGVDPKNPVQMITAPRLRPSVGAGARSRLQARRATAKQAAATAISITASCVVFISGDELGWPRG